MKHIGLGLALTVIFYPLTCTTASNLRLTARYRVEVGAYKNVYRVVTKQVELNPQHTAAIIIDMWNQHWCRSATARTRELAHRINRVVERLREAGVLIIHAPSGTMQYYANRAQRQRAMQAVRFLTIPPSRLSGWCGLQPHREPPLPIDDSDGGCDDNPQCEPGEPWTSQIDIIRIAPEDAISDSAPEIFGLLSESNRTNVLIMGVHLNKCVLGRPFGIRRLVLEGKNVFLFRDLTDSMYNPARRPWVSHFVGNDMVIEHIERYWCPTISSSEILGDRPFTFGSDYRPTITWIIGENEYQTWETLPDFALKDLSWRGFQHRWITASTNVFDYHFTNMEAVKNTDLIVISVRRRAAGAALLEGIKEHLGRGKPLIGIRTASHAFAPQGPQAQQLLSSHSELTTWPDFDKQVLGCNYHGHLSPGAKVAVLSAHGAYSHPILQGVDLVRAYSAGALYQVQPLSEDVTPILWGQTPPDEREPVAWVRKLPSGSRVFYTSLGHPEDFKQVWFRTLLCNAIHWCLGLPIPQQWLADPLPDLVEQGKGN